ncbi:MAG: HI0074 family nucleotidyltransferase substrate-binding subunit [Ruminococcus sp.]|nr:HI0074 family nucleotidyltransferase substrate-binding subunit [Ruminococcus sp.]
MTYNIPDRVYKDIIRFADADKILKIILFGSRAKGTHTDRSDIDIAVSGGDFDAFYYDIKEKIHSLLTFDVIDLDKSVSEELKKEIDRDGVIIYEKLDNFSNCLKILKTADFEMANNNEIYRTGVVGQFNITFELAWKALQAVLRAHGAEGSETGSPREILQLGYKVGFINDESVWITMLKKRNTAIHIYNEEDIDELLLLIRDSFIPAFAVLEGTLKDKMKGIDDQE